VSGEKFFLAEDRFVTDVSSVGHRDDSSRSGRLCFLSWSDWDGNDAAYVPRDAEFLRDCFPADSVFFVHAYTFTGTQDAYVVWKAAVVAPSAVEASTWATSWKAVNGVIKLGYASYKGNMHVVEPGGEAAALKARESAYTSEEGRHNCVKTGSLGLLRQALGFLDT
jgi:hypothetical protein